MSFAGTREALTDSNIWCRLLTCVAIYGPALGVFLLPALINRFPLLFVDSGTYLRTAIERFSPPDRPIYYSIFLYFIHWRTSLWTVIFVQAASTIAVAAIFLRRTLEPLSNRHLSILLLLFSALTSLSVFICQITPDLFTPLMVLSLCTLIFSNAALTVVERWFLYLIVLASICFHQANFLIAIVSLAAAFLVRMFVQGKSAPIKHFVAPSILIFIGVVLLVAPNLKHHSFSVTRGSNVFLLAKLIDDGVAFDYLTTVCPIRHYSVCQQLPAIQRYNKTATSAQKKDRATSDYFLWDAPLKESGGWDRVSTYASTVNFASVEREPWTFARESFRNFADQLLRFKTGEGISRHAETSFVSGALRMYFPPGVYRAFLDSRQQANSFELRIVSVFYQAVAVASVCVLFALLIGQGKIDPTLTAIALTLVLAVIGNAFIMGVLSAVHDRYQSRISCLIVMAALLLGYKWFLARVLQHNYQH
jgi:hypothetical protein